MNKTNGYQRAHAALLELKSVVLETLAAAGQEGLTNAELGRGLGIYHGYENADGVEGHPGHISRWLLGELQREEMVRQDSAKRWSVVGAISDGCGE